MRAVLPHSIRICQSSKEQELFAEVQRQRHILRYQDTLSLTYILSESRSNSGLKARV